MNLKEEIVVVVDVEEEDVEIKELKSMLATMPAENPTSIYFAEFNSIDVNFVIV